MRRGLKRFMALATAAALSVMTAFPACADNLSGWHKMYQGEEGQWYYFRDDLTFPVNEWEEIDGKWYHFDQDGHFEIGWHVYDGKFYYMYDDGVMAANVEMTGGHLGADGAWVNDRRSPRRAEDVTEEDYAYWLAKWKEYELWSDSFVYDGKGAYILEYDYDDDAVVPDIVESVHALAFYRFLFGDSDALVGNHKIIETVTLPKN